MLDSKPCSKSNVLLSISVAFNNGSRVFDEALCAANHTSFGGKESCKEAPGGNMAHYSLFILGMFVAGAGASPMYALGIPYIDENVKPKVSPMYLGFFVASGIGGKLLCYETGNSFSFLYIIPTARYCILVLHMQKHVNYLGTSKD